jgi:diamine N-acetyltransferase
MLKYREIELRALKDSDLDFLIELENDKENWQFGSENKQYSNHELSDYIKNAKTDITIAKQYRFVIDFHSSPIGFIDLFDYTINSANIGVIISRDYRRKGFAKDALNLLINYAFHTLNLSKLNCTIKKNNIPSIRLFSSFNFELEQEKDELQYFIKLAKK